MRRITPDKGALPARLSEKVRNTEPKANNCCLICIKIQHWTNVLLQEEKKFCHPGSNCLSGDIGGDIGCPAPWDMVTTPFPWHCHPLFFDIDIETRTTYVLWNLCLSKAQNAIGMVEQIKCSESCSGAWRPETSHKTPPSLSLSVQLRLTSLTLTLRLDICYETFVWKKPECNWGEKADKRQLKRPNGLTMIHTFSVPNKYICFDMPDNF